MNVLGIGGVLSDAAAVLIQDGQITAAVEEAKLIRRKQPGLLPEAAIASCMEIGGVAADEIDYVALARPLPPGPELAIALRRFLNAKIVSMDHHRAHANSAWLACPFDKATVITLDRAGDLRCGAKWNGEGARLSLVEEILFPNSMGDLYGRVTEMLGFRARSDEHLTQWLSTTGTPRMQLQLTGLEGSVLSESGLQSLLGLAPGKIKGQDRADLAASMQKVLEEYVLLHAGDAEYLCLAGGLAWNALLVRALEESGRFQGVFAQPAAGNAGTALGAALGVWQSATGVADKLDGGGYCLGPGFTPADIKRVLENCKLRFKVLPTLPDLLSATTDQLQQNRIVAWMQGRMEFGPRALGNRSILASPQDPYSTENLNTYIKHREGFRKFAASVPAELAGEYFEVGSNARYLATVGKVRAPYRQQFESAILAHDLIRVHTVFRDDNPLYWQLLQTFGERTGLPVLYNTSFNLFGEPLVCTPRDAVRSFYSSGIDALVAGNFLLEK
jgi:carbamoyltransferase